MQRLRDRSAGFTVIELLVTLAVFAVLLVLSLFFVHAKDFSIQNNDAQRAMDIAKLTQWLVRYHAEHGALPDGVTAEPKMIGSEDGQLDWCGLLVPAVFKEIPYDPASGAVISLGDNCTAEGSGYVSGYTVQFKDAVLTVSAPDGEEDGPITAVHKF